MPITTYSQTPYVDDFNTPDVNKNGKTAALEKNFLRILFKPSVSVQVRELNQLQSILQSQIDKFGRAIFKDGTPVINGLTTFNNNLFYVDVVIENATLFITDSQNQSVLVEKYIDKITSLENKKSNETGTLGLKSSVLGWEKSPTPNAIRFFIRYDSSIQDINGENITEYRNSNYPDGSKEQIVLDNELNNVVGDSILPKGSFLGKVVDVGYSAGLFVSEGIFFIKGEFVYTEKLSEFIIKPTKNYLINGDISFNVLEKIVSNSEDKTLLDNATGQPNFAAPGADRYTIDFELVFISKNKTPEDSTFISDNNNKVLDSSNIPSNLSITNLISIKDGKNIIPAKTEFSNINSVLAQRTFEESGNYVTETIITTVDEEDENFGEIIIEPGVAYIEGYRNELINPQKKIIQKARPVPDTNLQEIEKYIEKLNVGITANLGSYIKANLVSGYSDYLDNSILYTFDANGTTCRIRYIEIMDFSTLEAKIYIYDTNGPIPSSGNLNGTAPGNFVASINSGEIFDTENNESIYELPFNTVNSHEEIVVTEIIKFSSTVNLNSIALNIPAGKNSVFKSLNSKDYYIIDDSNGDILEPSNINLTGGGSSVTMDLTIASGNVTVFAPVESALPIPDSKTKNTFSELITIVNDESLSVVEFNYTMTTGSDFVIGEQIGLEGNSVTAIAEVLLNDTVNNVLRIKYLSSSVTPFNSGDDIQSATNNKIANIISAPTSVKKLNLTKSDIFELIDIKDEDGVATVLNSNESPYDFFDLNTGQRDGIYKTASIEYKGSGLSDGVYTLEYNYFIHSGSGNYFSADSYVIDTFKKNLSYKGKRLTDTLDFRAKEGDDAVVLKPGTLIQTVTNYYKSRIDILGINTLGEIIIIEGIPAINPEEPIIPDGILGLYKYFIPAFTFNIDDIKIEQIDNSVYTMNDISRIDTRIKNIEEELSLNDLEKNATDTTLLNNDGSERFKNGILVDKFEGHSRGNVFNRNYYCSIDYENNILKPAFETKNIPLIAKDTTEIGDKNILTLDETTAGETELFGQPYTNIAKKITEKEINSWVGVCKLSPFSDDWYDETNRPKVIKNDTGNYDNFEFLFPENNIFDTKWNFWNTHWFGEKLTKAQKSFGESKLKTVSLADGSSRTTFNNSDSLDTSKKVKEKKSSSKILEKKGKDGIVNSNIIPFIRSRKIRFKAEGLKPNTRVFAFFDGVNVTDYCDSVNDGFIEYDKNVNDFITLYTGQIDPATGNNLITDSLGRIEGSFIIPNNEELKFKTGQRSFRLIDSAINSFDDATTFCETLYHGTGLLNINNKSLRPLTKDVETFNVKKTNISERDSGFSSISFRDPIVQSFIINQEKDGIHLSSVDLYFKRKSNNVPVVVYITTMENGTPAMKKLPFSEKLLYPNNVNISADGTVPTKFKFDNDIYLTPGIEYGIVVKTASPEYELYFSESGETDISKDEKINNLKQSTSLFLSKNNNEWQIENTTEIKYTINRKQFESDNKDIIFYPAITGNDIKYSAFDLYANTLTHDSSKISYKVKVGNNSGGDAYDVTPGNIEILRSNDEKILNGKGIQEDELQVDVNLFQQTNPVVSPIIDLDRFSLIAIQNKINDDPSGETKANNTGNALSKYITREVTLKNSADKLSIYFDANLASSANDIKVFARFKLEDSDIQTVDFIELNPTLLPRINKDGSYNETLFEYETTGDDTFTAFQVKIVFLSSNPGEIPSIKNLKIISSI